jgi:hypothetical protein
MIRFIALTLFFLFYLPVYLPSSAQEPVATVMFYNLENLFDTRNDSLKLDDEFLPQGDRHWTPTRFYTKLTRISKVITNTGNWEPPAVIGMCEVENRDVLEKLIWHPPLRNWKYNIIHKESPDERGIDVAVLYRPEVFNPLSYRYFPPVPEGEKAPATREILYVCGILDQADTIHLFFNHWPSRYSGLMETRQNREIAAQRLKSEVDILQKKFIKPLIIIMGDFNDQPNDESILNHLHAGASRSGNQDALFNISYQWFSKGKGTLKFQSQWNIFDQIIVSEAVLDSTGNLFAHEEDARILDASFLLERDETYTGMKLNRTYNGFSYHGGYSDHLPVLLMLRKKNAIRIFEPQKTQ